MLCFSVVTFKPFRHNIAQYCTLCNIVQHTGQYCALCNIVQHTGQYCALCNIVQHTGQYCALCNIVHYAILHIVPGSRGGENRDGQMFHPYSFVHIRITLFINGRSLKL